jgi:cleavage and polyadenylation specificity factor subunit 1
MLDEETGTEPRVLSASIVDPYLLLIRDDSSAFVVHIDSSNELEELDRKDPALLSTKWISGSLYSDQAGVFSASLTGKESKTEANVFMFLLSAAGALYVSIRCHIFLAQLLLTLTRSINYLTFPSQFM